jgi:hypothetical protein
MIPIMAQLYPANDNTREPRYQFSCPVLVLYAARKLLPHMNRSILLQNCVGSWTARHGNVEDGKAKPANF